MARIKTKDLKTQYMIRVYKQDEHEVFKQIQPKQPWHTLSHIKTHILKYVV